MPARKKSRLAARGNPQPTQGRGTARSKRSHTAETRNGRPSRTSLLQSDLWVAPRTSLTRQEDGVAAWNLHSRTSRDARLLELADIALGLRKPEPFRKRKSLFLSAQNGKRSN